jgi:hypothetical protein
MYHVGLTHRGAQLALLQEGEDVTNADLGGLPGKQFSDPRMGHGAGFFIERLPSEKFADGLMNQIPMMRGYNEKANAEAEKRLGKLRAYGFGGGHFSVFPSAGGLAAPSFFRVAHPRGPHQMEFWVLCLVPADAPEAFKRAKKVNQEHTFAPAGILEQDDGENWVTLQEVLRGHVARRSHFAAVMGKGHYTENDKDFPGRISHVFAEEGGRNFYAAWQRLLRGDSWEEMGFGRKPAARKVAAE